MPVQRTLDYATPIHAAEVDPLWPALVSLLSGIISFTLMTCLWVAGAELSLMSLIALCVPPAIGITLGRGGHWRGPRQIMAIAGVCLCGISIGGYVPFFFWAIFFNLMPRC